MMWSLPSDATQASHIRYAVALELAQHCPLHFAQEIALVGSAGWGCADANSDLDLVLWAEKIPLWTERLAWLTSLGVTDIRPDAELGAICAPSIVCRFRTFWLDIAWVVLDPSQEQTAVQAILAGDVLDHEALLKAWNLAHALPLRTTGMLPALQHQLSDYPDRLQQRLISSAITFWTFPHRVNMLWTLAQRGELLALDRWLYADLTDALRILFAFNRQWEPDWKQLHWHVQRLRIAPERLVERVNAALTQSEPHQRIAATMQLVLEIVALVPASTDVSLAQHTLEQSLAAHTSMRRE